jgi:hypothetical protein
MMSTSIYDFPNTTIMGVHYLPGFQTDLTSWTLTIDERSRLTQTLQTFEAVPKNARYAVIQLDDELVLEWMTYAEALDFTALQQEERRFSSIDDASTYTLMCHFGAAQQSITLRTLDYWVMHGHPDMIAFRTLWDAIHAVAPFPQTRRPWSTAR